jgi:hypothetical protein
MLTEDVASSMSPLARRHAPGHAFVVRVADTPDGYSRWPDYATSPERVQSVFERFALPGRID